MQSNTGFLLFSPHEVIHTEFSPCSKKAGHALEAHMASLQSPSLQKGELDTTASSLVYMDRWTTWTSVVNFQWSLSFIAPPTSLSPPCFSQPIAIFLLLQIGLFKHQVLPASSSQRGLFGCAFLVCGPQLHFYIVQQYRSISHSLSDCWLLFDASKQQASSLVINPISGKKDWKDIPSKWN